MTNNLQNGIPALQHLNRNKNGWKLASNINSRCKTQTPFQLLLLSGFIQQLKLGYDTEKNTNTHTTVLRPFFRDHPDKPVPEENFWTLWCKGRLIEADTPTIWLGATPSGLSSAHLHHPPDTEKQRCLKEYHETVGKTVMLTVTYLSPVIPFYGVLRCAHAS